MKTKFKNVLLLTFFALLTLTSCQNEITEITEPDQEQVIVAESPLATLMRSTSVNNGMADNIMDDTDCMSISLPVTIIVNSITITINTHDDLELIRDIFEEFTDDDDEIDFIFPITIILNDYTEIVIDDRAGLEDFIEGCDDEEEVIECVDFVYPISFSIYNTSFQVIETVEIENDAQLYHFMERIENAEQAILASLNFPVKLKYANGETVEVHNNNELEAAINEGEDMCDDEDDCEIDDVDSYLTECHWNIHYYNDDDNYRPFNLVFNEDGVLKIFNTSQTSIITGNWNTSETDEGVVLTISELTDFDEALGGDWLIKECEDDRFKFVKINTPAGTELTRIVLKQRCEDEPDCGPQELRMSLKECRWYAGSNLYGSGDLGKFHFGPEGVLTMEDSSTAGSVVTGTWEVALTDYGIKLILELPEPYEDLSGYWKIYQCDDERIKVIREDSYIVFEQDCDDECAMEVQDMEEYLLDCRITSKVYDENENLVSTYKLNFNPNYGFLVSETPNQVEEGHWSVMDTEDGLKLSLENLTTFNLIDGNWLYVDCYDDVLVFKQTTDNGFRIMKIEKDCNNLFECFENTEFIICDEGDTYDGFEVFDLNSVYDDCPNDDVEITFHLSEGEAHNNIEALPTEYTNVSNSQTIFARVTLAGTNSYEVFMVVLYVENCNACSEEEIDSYLSEPGCHWIPVSLGGSDDFSAYDLYFNDNLDLVVKDGDGNETVGTWSTSQGTGTGVVVSISQIATPYDAFNKEWVVTECGTERMVLKNNNVELILERECL